MASTTAPSSAMNGPTIDAPDHGSAAVLAPGGEFSAWTERFEAIYRDAAGGSGAIPWDHGRPCSALVSWLNAQAAALVRPGARAAVVGCGLGYDACALADRGYDVTAFDVCPTAVESARARHPEGAEMFIRADLLALPARMIGRYDLVVEVHTLQALPPDCRSALAGGMAQLLSHHGVVVAVARCRDAKTPLDAIESPPWEFTAPELVETMGSAGLSPTGVIDEFLDDSDPPVRRLRGVFSRGG